MTAEVFARLGEVAEDWWGMFTSSQAAEIGVSPHQLSRLVRSGALERPVQGVYRMAGAPPTEGDLLRAYWLALGGYKKTSAGVADVVAAGTTAAGLHGVGDFYTDKYDFVVPRRRGTRLQNVRLRTRELSRKDVSRIDGLPVMRVERMIADLVEGNQDLSLVGDVVGDAHRSGLISSEAKLAHYLDPLARRNQQASGADMREYLYDIAGVSIGR